MWWWLSGSNQDFDDSDSSGNGTELDSDLLEQLGDKWMDDYMSEDDDDARRVLWEAIQVCRQRQDEPARK